MASIAWVFERNANVEILSNIFIWIVKFDKQLNFKNGNLPRNNGKDSYLSETWKEIQQKLLL